MTKQQWQCPEENCDGRYDSPILISGITCPRAKNHPRGGSREMVLVAGRPPRDIGSSRRVKA